MSSADIGPIQQHIYSNIHLFISDIHRMFRPTISAIIRRYYKNIEVKTEFNFTMLSAD